MPKVGLRVVKDENNRGSSEGHLGTEIRDLVTGAPGGAPGASSRLRRWRGGIRRGLCFRVSTAHLVGGDWESAIHSFGVCLVSGEGSKGSSVRTSFIYRPEPVSGDSLFKSRKEYF